MAMMGNTLVLADRHLIQMTVAESILTCSDDRENAESFSLKRVDKLICTKNFLQTLPIFPDHLQELWCFENQLKSLPSLPKQLKVLECSYNQLQSLPELPETLERLYCFCNQLQTLPKLPESLKKLQTRGTISIDVFHSPPLFPELPIYRKKYQTYFYLITYLALHHFTSPSILSNEAWWFPGTI
jgi:hypothetical protein